MEDNILEIDFMKVRELREKNISRTEALDQIKPVEYLPECKLLTAKMAAKYYGASEVRIQAALTEFKSEFEESGDMINLKASDFNVTLSHKVTRGNLGNQNDHHQEIDKWLKHFLSSGPQKTNDVMTAGLAAGFSKKRLNTAKERLGIESVKKTSHWEWNLPDNPKVSDFNGSKAIPNCGTTEGTFDNMPNYEIKQVGPNAKAYYDGVFLFNIGGKGINLINKRGLLRLGMLLDRSDIARQVRDYLLTMYDIVEERHPEILNEAAEKVLNEYHSIVSRSLEEIKEDNIKASINVERRIDVLAEEIKTLTKDNHELREVIFGLYKNTNTMFSKVVTEFAIKFHPDKADSAYRFNLFYGMLEKLTGYKIPKTENLPKKYKTIKAFVLAEIPNALDVLRNVYLAILTDRLVYTKGERWIIIDGPLFSDIEWERLLLEQRDPDEPGKYICIYCGKSFIRKDIIKEHLIPQSHPDSSDMTYNIICSCRECNEKKFGQRYDEFFTPENENYCPERMEFIKEHIRIYYYEKEKKSLFQKKKKNVYQFNRAS